jgi:CRP-like cAMP-binding protein
MQLEAISRQMDAVATHSLANLLDCPPAVETLLKASAQWIDFKAGEAVFRQSETCKGLYLIVSGRFLRKTERLEMLLTLGQAYPGDLVELAAVLGSGQHTYTLNAQSSGSVLLLPIETLNQVFQSYPLMRMHLLEELAREVCRAYYACSLNRVTRTRHHLSGAAVA